MPINAIFTFHGEEKSVKVLICFLGFRRLGTKNNYHWKSNWGESQKTEQAFPYT